MNILHVTKGSLMGGGERHILSLIEGFAVHPEHTFYLAVFSEGFLSIQARHHGITVFVIPKSFRGDIRPVFSLCQIIGNYNIDIVHTHLISGNFYGRIASKIKRVNVFTTLHHTRQDALEHFSYSWLQRLFFYFDVKMNALTDCVIAPSKDLKQALIKEKINKDKVVHIPNGISLEHLTLLELDRAARRQKIGFSQQDKLVGMVGRMVSIKNFELLLRAAQQFLANGNSATFLLIGDGPRLKELQGLAEELGIKDKVIFTGFRDDRLEFMSILDIFVLCSHSETFPLALIEAMSLARPVIATDVGGIPEIIDDMENGFLCPPNDEDTLAYLIDYVFRNEDHAQEVGRKAQQKVIRQLSVHTMTDRLIHAYEHVYRSQRRE